MVELLKIKDTIKLPEFNSLEIYKSHLLKRVALNKNFMCCLLGQTGSGKSYSALSLGEHIDKTFNIDNVVFTPEEFITLLNENKLHAGSVIVYDEIGCTQNARDWFSQTNKMLNNILATFRHLNLIVFFTVPAIIFVDRQARTLFHGIIECRNIDTKNDVCYTKPLFLRYDQKSDDIWQTFLRVALKGGEVRKLTVLQIPKPSKHLIKLYEDKRFDFTSKLYSFDKIRDGSENVVNEEKQENEGNINIAKRFSKNVMITNLASRGMMNKDISEVVGCSIDYVVNVKTKARKVKVLTEIQTKRDEDFFDDFVNEGGVKEVEQIPVNKVA